MKGLLNVSRRGEDANVCLFLLSTYPILTWRQLPLKFRGGEIVTEPERTVAILNIPEATPNTVKSAERKLINSVEVDGLKCVTSSALVFAQYDEVFKMGKRRVEVWKDVESIWN